MQPRRRTKPMRSPTLHELPPPPEGRYGWPWTEDGHRLADLMPDGRAWPRVSVVTPSFNQADFIEETIRSVLLQGYPDLEYIVMDGGSRDGSAELIARYSEWLAHWTSEPDGGQSDAINKGWERATGEVVTWLNSDDVYRPGAIAAAAARLMSQPAVGLVYGRADVCGREGLPTGIRYGREFVIEELAEGRCPVPQPSAFIRRTALDAAGTLDPSLHFAMDADLWLRLAAVADVRFVDEVWSNFRHHPDSKTGQGRLRFEVDTYEFVRQGFDRSTLPRHILKKRGWVLARLVLRVAMAHYRQGNDRQSRVFAAQALRLSSSIIIDRKMRVDLCRCLLGRTLVGRLKTLRLARA
jgi:glycosyltransferase involved in cell wall biosynthesis